MIGIWPTDVSPRRRWSAAVVVSVLAVAVPTMPAPARAGDDGANAWNTVLEKLDLKATPAAPPPDFVERTRPDPGGLGYIQPAVPHKVSPLPVKTPAQIQAAKDALDAARTRQLSPGPTPPAELAKGKKPQKAKADAAVAK